MFDFETSVGGIELGVSRLCEEVRRLRQAMEEKENECQMLKEALENKEKTINKLEEENKIIKTGNRLTREGETAEMKAKVDRMIETVDRCIAMIGEREG